MASSEDDDLPGGRFESAGADDDRGTDLRKIPIRRLLSAAGNLTLGSVLLLLGLLSALLGASFELGQVVATFGHPTQQKPDSLLAVPGIPIGKPSPGKAGILVDVSHGQSLWRDSSVFDLENGPLASVESVEIHALDDRGQYLSEDLLNWDGLIVGLPYHDSLTTATIERVAGWVRAGGRLMLMSYELGDEHHGSNLNSLAGEFGISFSNGIVAPAGWRAEQGKPYSAAVRYAVRKPDHPILRGLSSLDLWRTTTTYVVPGGRELLTLGRNTLAWPLPSSVLFDSAGQMSVPSSAFELREAPWLSVLVESPPGLVGQGGVVGLGTWDFAGRHGESNRSFLDNLVHWLAGN